MPTNTTGRRLLLATVALIAANVVCVFLAVDSGATESMTTGLFWWGSS